jgi:c-di-GMP-binding flagellar brake protein YcgR
MADGSNGRLSARIRNVSRGGINLIVKQPFAPGDMISLDVPGSTSEEADSVLACIVHVHPLPDGLYALGCAFSEMLDEEDLAGFINRKERPSSAEKRECARHIANVSAAYQLVSDPEKKNWPAQVINLSLGGIGLQVEQAVDTGALLNLNLQNTSGQARTILACVVHVMSRNGNERVLGCNFIHEMSEADFKALL